MTATAEKAQPAEKAAPPAAKAPADAVEATRLTLFVHPTIGSLCQVPAPKAYFPFDSAKLSWDDEAVVKAVVECLGKDDLREEKLRVIGRASVKGPAKYNRELAMKRAKSVADGLVEAGLDRSRLTLVARGEKGFDAPATQAGYAFQRRVDLQLIDPRPQMVEMTYWDVDADEKMNLSEFYAGVVDMVVIDGFDTDGGGGLDEKETGDFVLGTWDEDGDGAVEKDEWGFGAKGWDPEDDRFGRFETWDTDGDGRIEGKEWGPAFDNSEIHETWDTDKDGVLYDHELVAGIFGFFDLDGDGYLDNAEKKNLAPWRPAGVARQ